MKKFLVAIMAVVMAVLAMSLVACGNLDVKGKSFVYDSYKIMKGELTEEEKADIEASMQSGEFAFGEDGVVTAIINGMPIATSSYKQEGDKITATSSTGYTTVFMVEDGKIYMDEEYSEALVIRVYLKVK